MADTYPFSGLIVGGVGFPDIVVLDPANIASIVTSASRATVTLTSGGTGSGSTGAVDSVFGRAGVVVAVQSDYTYLRSFNARTGPAISPVQSDYTYLQSFNGRTGPAIAPVGGGSDYSFVGVTNLPLGPSGTVLKVVGSALSWSVDSTGGGGGAVDSVFGRTGVVTAVQSDYTYLTSFAGRTGPAISAVQSDYTYLQSFAGRTGPAIAAVQSDYTYLRSFSGRTGPTISPVGGASDYSFVGVTNLPLGADGTVLKVVGSALSWSADSQGAGGGSAFTLNLAIGSGLTLTGSSSATTIGTSLFSWDYSRSTVSGTNATTSLYSVGFPANVLGVGQMAKIRLEGAVLNDTGANRVITYGVRHYGSGSTQTIWGDITGNIGTSATLREMEIELDILPSASTNSLYMRGRILIGGAGSSSVSGVGEITVNQLLYANFRSFQYPTDLTSRHTVEITVTHSTASSLINSVRQLVTVEVV